MGCASSREEDKSAVYKSSGPEGKAPAAAVAGDNEEIPKLEGAKKQEVMSVFKQFDVKSDGKIAIAQLKSAKMKVGPSETKLLQTLADMDFNGDGFVEAHEWEMYFATVCAELSDIDLKVVMDDLKEAGSDIVTVYQCSLLAEAAGSEAAAAADAEDAAAAAEEMEQMALKGAQKAMVEGLFKEWDFNGNGEIDRSKLQTTGVEVGPRKAKVFSDFELMDENKDGIVTLDEMLAYFGVAASMMSEDEFAATVSEMREVAEAEKSVAAMVQLAAEAAEPTPQGTGEEAMEETPPLSAERKALVDALFTTYSPDLATPIDLETLRSSGQVEMGPAKENLLEGLAAMDANGDGKVEHSEMIFYFTFVGASLNDGEFEAILGDLKDRAAAGQALKEAVRQS